MRPLFSRAALVTVCALFACLLASPAWAAPRPLIHPLPAPAPDPRPHPVLLAKSYTAPVLIVRRGDTLSSIAARACHHASFWPEVWWANRRKVRNPDAIFPGEKLRMPACTRTRARHAAEALAAIPAPPPPPAPAAAAPAAPPAGAAAPAPVQATASYSGSGSFRSCVLARESGGNYGAVNPTSGAGGAYQFLPSTWASTPYGSQYPGGAQTAPASVQDAAFAWEYAQAGASPWSSYDGC